MVSLIRIESQFDSPQFSGQGDSADNSQRARRVIGQVMRAAARLRVDVRRHRIWIENLWIRTELPNKMVHLKACPRGIWHKACCFGAGLAITHVQYRNKSMRSTSGLCRIGLSEPFDATSLRCENRSHHFLKNQKVEDCSEGGNSAQNLCAR